MKAIDLINEYKKINGCSVKEFVETTLNVTTPEHSKIEFQVFNAACNDISQIYYKGVYYTHSVASGNKEYMLISFGGKGTFDYSIDHELSNEDNAKAVAEQFNDFISKKFSNEPKRWTLYVTHVALGVNGTYDNE